MGKKDNKQKKDKKFIVRLVLTNMVTMLRLAGAVALIPVFLKYGGLVAAGLLAGVFATDFVDGQMARRMGTSTFFGMFLDAASDKVIGILSLATLLLISKFALIPIALEATTLGVNFLKYLDKQNVHSYFSGKLKTLALSLGVIASFVVSGLVDLGIIKNIEASKAILPVLLGMVPFEVVALTEYINDYRKQRNEKIDSEIYLEDELEDLEKYGYSKRKVETIEKERAELEAKKAFWKEYVRTHETSALLDHELYEQKHDDADFSTDVSLYFAAAKEERQARKLSRKKK